jgi:PAS domain-containing protein
MATETTGVGVWEWSVKTNLAIWDAQMFRIYGMEPTPDGIVSYDAWAAVVLPEDLRQQEMLLRTLLRRGGVSRREFRIRRPSDNEIRVIEAVERAREGADGEIETCVGTNLYVTENRRAATALRRSWRKERAARIVCDREKWCTAIYSLTNCAAQHNLDL